MKLTRFVGLLAAVLTVSSIGAALAGGLFNNLPTVGGAAYCALYAGDGTTCQGSVPAGPSVTTGLETVPADTNAASGASPQTVRLGLASLNALPYQYNAPLTGATVAVAATTGTMLLDPAGTIATLTVTLPAATALIDGQQLSLASSQTVTALTLTGGTGTTISNAPTAITISTTGPYNYRFIYRAANTKWYRML